MAPTMKISLLALIGAAAAAPNYPYAHSKYHQSSDGYAGPTGGWGTNSTATAPIDGPIGAPTGYPTVIDDQTTTLHETRTSTETLVETVYATKSKPAGGNEPSSVAGLDVPAGGEAPASGEACGPATVYVTATAKVTVTVPAGGADSGKQKTETLVVSAEPVDATETAAVPAYGEEPTTNVEKESEPSTYPESDPPAEAEPTSDPKPQPSPEENPDEDSEEDTEEPSKESPTQEVPAPTSPAEEPEPTKPSSPPSSSGGKRGLIYRWDGASDAKAFGGKRDFAFASNWEAEPKGDIGSTPFIPTLRSLDRAGDWPNLVEKAVSGGSKIIFTFNEPDIQGQADMTPDAACKAWEKHVSPIIAKHSDVTIVGPSISSSDEDGKGLSWYSAFQKQCPQAKWTKANYHWYGYGGAAFDEFKAYIERANAEVGKNFYVTEFGLHEASDAASAEFLEKAQEYLDNHPNCEGYSYFAVGNFDASYNLLGTAENPTLAGKTYLG